MWCSAGSDPVSFQERCLAWRLLCISLTIVKVKHTEHWKMNQSLTHFVSPSCSLSCVCMLKRDGQDWARVRDRIPIFTNSWDYETEQGYNEHRVAQHSAVYAAQGFSCVPVTGCSRTSLEAALIAIKLKLFKLFSKCWFCLCCIDLFCEIFDTHIEGNRSEKSLKSPKNNIL